MNATVKATESGATKVIYYFTIFFFFLMFLSIIGEVLNISVLDDLVEFGYAVGSGLLLIINFFVGLLRVNGIDIFFMQLFTFIIKGLAWLGLTIGSIIEGILLGIVNLLGNIFVRPWNEGSGVICLTTGASCHIDIDNPPNKTIVDFWVYLDFTDGSAGIGGRARGYNKIKFLGSTLFVQSDYIYLVGGFSIPKFGVFLKGFLFVKASLELFLVGWLNDVGGAIDSFFPSWRDIFEEFYKFSTSLELP